MFHFITVPDSISDFGMETRYAVAFRFVEPPRENGKDLRYARFEEFRLVQNLTLFYSVPQCTISILCLQ